MKKNEISGQKFAFVRKNYEHKYYEGGDELEESINTKHEKFKKVGRNLKKIKEVTGNKTPYWVAKLHTVRIEGINKDKIIEFSVEEDTPELIVKYLNLDIALKKFYLSSTTDRSDKKAISKISEDEMEELMSEMPDMILQNPVGPMKSAYAKVMEDFLLLIKNYIQEQNSDIIFEKV